MNAYSLQTKYKSIAYDKAVLLSNAITVKDWGKEHIDLGVTRSNDLLRSIGVFQKGKNEPYQKFYDKGWFVKGRAVDKQTLDMCEYKTTPEVFITPEGMTEIIKLVLSFKSKPTYKSTKSKLQQLRRQVNISRSFVEDDEEEHF